MMLPFAPARWEQPWREAPVRLLRLPSCRAPRCIPVVSLYRHLQEIKGIVLCPPGLGCFPETRTTGPSERAD